MDITNVKSMAFKVLTYKIEQIFIIGSVKIVFSEHCS